MGPRPCAEPVRRQIVLTRGADVEHHIQRTQRAREDAQSTGTSSADMRLIIAPFAVPTQRFESTRRHSCRLSSAHRSNTVQQTMFRHALAHPERVREVAIHVSTLHRPRGQRARPLGVRKSEASSGAQLSSTAESSDVHRRRRAPASLGEVGSRRRSPYVSSREPDVSSSCVSRRDGQLPFV